MKPEKLLKKKVKLPCREMLQLALDCACEGWESKQDQVDKLENFDLNLRKVKNCKGCVAAYFRFKKKYENQVPLAVFFRLILFVEAYLTLSDKEFKIFMRLQNNKAQN